MNSFEFKQLTNYKRDIVKKLSQHFEINSGTIEILKPIQTTNGINMTFHIRVSVKSLGNSNKPTITPSTTNNNGIAGHEQEMHRLVKMVNDDKDTLCEIMLNQWKSRFTKQVWNQGKVTGVETRKMRATGNTSSSIRSTNLNELERQSEHAHLNDAARDDLDLPVVDDEETEDNCNHDEDHDTVEIGMLNVA